MNVLVYQHVLLFIFRCIVMITSQTNEIDVFFPLIFFLFNNKCQCVIHSEQYFQGFSSFNILSSVEVLLLRIQLSISTVCIIDYVVLHLE